MTDAKHGTCDLCMHAEDRKKRFKPGPWDHEPDRYEFTIGGIVCLVHRIYLGSLCGYIGVEVGHPWHGVDYDDVDAAGGWSTYVHGDLTYASIGGGPIQCRTPDFTEDGRWYLGFDTNHSGDYAPFKSIGSSELDANYRIRFGHSYGEQRPHETYRDMAYVLAEVSRLANMAIVVMPEPLPPGIRKIILGD